MLLKQPADSDRIKTKKIIKNFERKFIKINNHCDNEIDQFTTDLITDLNSQ